MAHRGKPKKRFFRKKKPDNVIPLKPPRPDNPCFSCDVLNMIGKIAGHPKKGHVNKATGQRCTCWCNQ